MTSAMVEAEVVSNASSASAAGGFAGVYKDPQARVAWGITGACAVIAVRESDGREIRGWCQGPALSLQFKNDQKVEATLRGCGYQWEEGGRCWIKEWAKRLWLVARHVPASAGRGDGK